MLDTRVWLYCTSSLNRNAKALKLTCGSDHRQCVQAHARAAKAARLVCAHLSLALGERPVNDVELVYARGEHALPGRRGALAASLGARPASPAQPACSWTANEV